eukprot:SAG11_NODE_1800_length_4243_cov_4.590734_4_plen_198_part_00
MEVSVSFFNLHSIELQSSHLSFSAWLRFIYVDPRLAFQPQCYGGVAQTELQASSGELEESRLWTPDVELYNHEQPLWGSASSLGSRLAIVYACSGTPHGGSCGRVFWSRPGVISALCRFKGLVMFPYETLRCELELAAWATDGRAQDILPRAADGGVNWVDKPATEGSIAGMAGLTAGSTYQDYRIESVCAFENLDS